MASQDFTTAMSAASSFETRRVFAQGKFLDHRGREQRR
jgi:hypothetical protein